jgi:hypothetical protein
MRTVINMPDAELLAGLAGRARAERGFARLVIGAARRLPAAFRPPEVEAFLEEEADILRGRPPVYSAARALAQARALAAMQLQQRRPCVHSNPPHARRAPHAHRCSRGSGGGDDGGGSDGPGDVVAVAAPLLLAVAA